MVSVDENSRQVIMQVIMFEQVPIGKVSQLFAELL